MPARGSTVTKRTVGRFARIIRDRLADLQWSQVDLARQYGCSPDRIRRLLMQTQITEGTFLRLLDAVGLELDVLQVDRPAPPPSFSELEAARKSVRLCGELGESQAATELDALLANRWLPSRQEFDQAMEAAQRGIVRGKTRLKGWDPDKVLDPEWRA